MRRNNTKLIGAKDMTVAQLKKELLNHQDDEKVSVLFYKNNNIRNPKKKFISSTVVSPTTVVKNPGYDTTCSPVCQVRPYINHLGKHRIRKHGNVQSRLKKNSRR